MKKLFTLKYLLLPILFVSFNFHWCYGQTTIAKWTFDADSISKTPGSSPIIVVGSYTAEVGAQTAGSAFTGFHASTATVWSTPAGNGSAKSLSANTWAVGDYFQFSVNTAPFASNYSIAFDQTGSSTGPRDFKVKYSTDGTTFNDFTGNTYVVPNFAGVAVGWSATTAQPVSTLSFDLSSITAINNASTVYFRIIDNSTTAINGATVATGGTDRVDNFTVISNNTGATSSSTDYFRTRTSGIWSSPNTWESSPVLDFSTGLVSPATISPIFDANTITIQNGHTATIAASIPIDQTVINSGGIVLVNPNIVLTINDGTVGADVTVNSGGNLTIKSTLTGTGSIGNSSTATISGDVTVERYISSSGNRAYRLLAPSVTTSTSIHANWQEGATSNNPTPGGVGNPNPGYGTHITGTTTDQMNGFDGTSSGQGSLFTYDRTTPYLPATNTNIAILDAKTGYLIYIRGDRGIDLTSTSSPLPSTNTTLRATGTVLTGTQTFPGLAATSGNFSLVTNPYPSAIKWNTISAANTANVVTSYTYVDPNIGTSGGYVTVTNAGVASPVPTNNPGVNIQSGQAFFVQTGAAPTTLTLTIQESDKSTTNNIDAFRTATASQMFTTSLYFNDPVLGRRLADGVTALYDNTYNAALDDNDALEINNFDENIAIARAGKHLSIEERPIIASSDSLPLFVNHMKQRSYEFEFNPTNLDPTLTAQLVDKFKGNRTNLSTTASSKVPFTVTSEAASSAADRFLIVFNPSTISVAPPVITTMGAIKLITVYPNPITDNNITLQLNDLSKGNYTLILSNKLGQHIYTRIIEHSGGSATKTIALIKGLATGIYQLNITGNGIGFNQQIIKK